MSRLRGGAARRRLVLGLLAAAVLAVHLSLAAWVAGSVGLPGGARDGSMRKIDVAFVQALQPAAPPAVAPAPPLARAQAEPRPGAAPRPAPAASDALPQAPDEPASAALPAGDDARGAAAPAAPGDGPPVAGEGGRMAQPPPSGPPVEPGASPVTAEPQPPTAADPGRLPPRAGGPPGIASFPALPAAGPASGPVAALVSAVAAASAARAATPAVPFEWPPSTRLSYTLVGDYRGPVHGTATVEWLRRGERYQVHLQVQVGPLLERRMSSEGEVSDQGLRPRRYQEETRVLFQKTRRAEVRFDDDRVLLATQEALPRLPGVQDTASQFVQLTWLFTTQSHRLRVGESIEMPLALPRRMDRWHYDVQARQTLDTPVGPLDTFHMKPRRATPRPGELSIESWFAPSLQYLPVRILIRQDDATFIDLTLSRAPEQAVPEPSGR